VPLMEIDLPTIAFPSVARALDHFRQRSMTPGIG
jgi:hypothetical protein